MVRNALVALAFLSLVLGCRCFSIPPAARRWRRRTLDSKSVAGNSICFSSKQRGIALGGVTVLMSVKDMIGADVESGGLFDPMGRWMDGSRF